MFMLWKQFFLDRKKVSSHLKMYSEANLNNFGSYDKDITTINQLKNHFIENTDGKMFYVSRVFNLLSQDSNMNQQPVDIQTRETEAKQKNAIQMHHSL